jgi:hypothetical protein
MPRFAVFAALLIASAASWSQALPPQPEAPLDGRRNQKIERIVHEDAGNRIEEVRYAGQTQSITVQPKGQAPGYEVAPSTPTRGRVADERTGGAGGGQRFWNVFNF